MNKPISEFKTNPAWTRYQNAMNEGGEGYNPHQRAIKKTRDEVAAELSARGLGESEYQAKRELFNAAVKAVKQVKPSQVPAMCKKAGFDFLQDLKLAVGTFA